MGDEAARFRRFIELNDQILELEAIAGLQKGKLASFQKYLKQGLRLPNDTDGFIVSADVIKTLERLISPTDKDKYQIEIIENPNCEFFNLSGKRRLTGQEKENRRLDIGFAGIREEGYFAGSYQLQLDAARQYASNQYDLWSETEVKTGLNNARKMIHESAVISEKYLQIGVENEVSKLTYSPVSVGLKLAGIPDKHLDRASLVLTLKAMITEREIISINVNKLSSEALDREFHILESVRCGRMFISNSGKQISFTNSSFDILMNFVDDYWHFFG